MDPRSPSAHVPASGWGRSNGGVLPGQRAAAESRDERRTASSRRKAFTNWQATAAARIAFSTVDKAVLGMLRQLRLEPLLEARRGPQRDAVVAMIVARIVQPRSKLATARELRTATLASTLGELLNLSDCDEELLYKAMDWLLPRQERIERALAKRHLSEGTLALLCRNLGLR